MRTHAFLGFAVAVLLLSSSFDVARASTSEWSDWSEPVNLGAVNSSSNEQNAFLSKDGLTIYFTSDRPGGLGSLDLWVAHRASIQSDWQPPVNLGAPINSSVADFGPNLSIDGHLLFFASFRPGGQGGSDIYVSRRDNPDDDFGWQTPVNLGPPINTPDQDQAPFYRQNVEDGQGNLYFNRGVLTAQRGDIYYASIDRDGEPNGPVVFVTELNTAVNDYAVTIRHDGREIFFTSSRDGTNDIWTTTRQSVHHPWTAPEKVGPPISTADNEVTPQLSFDGRTLIFGTNRAGGSGGNDLWMSTRTPGH